MTFDELREEIKILDPVLQEEDKEFKVAAIMLSALEVGSNVANIIRFTGYDLDLILEVSANLRRNRVWIGQETHANWDDEEHGTLSFWLDALVGSGLVERVPDSVDESVIDHVKPGTKSMQDAPQN